jgi:hypothetical protein
MLEYAIAGSYVERMEGRSTDLEAAVFRHAHRVPGRREKRPTR